MNTDMTLESAERCRAYLHQLVDQYYDRLVQSIKTGEPLPAQNDVLPLSADSAQFKGRKPMAVIFPDGRRVDVSKWKAVAVVILQECVGTPLYGERLMAIRGKVMGRDRMILAASPDGMNVPLEIIPELFMEGKFDTESLLYVLTKRILEPVGYSYHNIKIELRGQ